MDRGGKRGRKGTVDGRLSEGKGDVCRWGLEDEGKVRKKTEMERGVWSDFRKEGEELQRATEGM